MGGVPIARRTVLADGRRFAMSTLGVGLAVALILLLQGLWTGALAQVSAYARNAGADLFVTEQGVRNPGESSLPITDAATVRRVAGVSEADATTVRSVILELDGEKEPVVVVGFRPGGLGGPWTLVGGRTVRSDDEVVLDSALAADRGIALGERLDLFGVQLEVVGLSSGTRTFVGGSHVFISEEEAEALFQTPGIASAILVRTAEPDVAAEAIRSSTGLSVLTAAEVGEDAEASYRRTLGTVLGLMIAIAFAAGTFTVALTVYSVVTDRLRDYGIAKAMGANRSRLLRIVLGQTLLLAGTGSVAGYVLFLVAARGLVAAMPEFQVDLPPSALALVGGAAITMAALAAVVPAHRVARLDPASVYRG